jgi:subtilisin-like proprotein convertase family protein
MGLRSVLTTTCAVVCAALMLSAAPPSEPGVNLVVGVWDASGNRLQDADVVGSVAGGEMIKAVEQAGNHILTDAGTLTPDGIKMTLEVHSAAWGVAFCDLLFVPTNDLVLQLVFTGQNEVEAYSPDFAPGTPPGGTGDGVSNDLCENALDIALDTPTAGSTVGATIDTPPTCFTSVTAGGVWYRVSGTGNTMTASTCSVNTAYDTKLSVFCGSCDDLTCIDGNDDNCALPGFFSELSWCSQAGADYYILVHGFSSATGSFELTVTDDGVACDDAIDCLPAEPTGACCFDDGSCDQLTAAECAAAGGSYQGDDVPCFGSGEATEFSDPANAPIPDDDPIGLTRTINVPSGATVGDVNLTLDIAHTWQGDLIVTLSHGGTSVVVVDRPGEPAVGSFGCSTDNYIGVVLDDEGTGGAIEDLCVDNLSSPPNYTPNNPLSAFDGMDPTGDWTLNITDNAAADTGSLINWTLTLEEAGDPTCEPPECFLVIGNDQGSDPFVGANHEFTTQVEDIEDDYAVLMESIPEFVLPPLQRGGQQGLAGVFGQLGGEGPTLIDAPDSPAWMQDGQFAVQVMMWNPNVFPDLPEQFTAGLMVEVQPNGQVVATPYGDNLGGLLIWHEISVNEAGQRVIRFPFLVPGM